MAQSKDESGGRLNRTEGRPLRSRVCDGMA